MDTTNYTKLFDGNFILVQRIVSELKHVGIIPIIKDETESGRLAGFGSPIQGFQEIFVSSNEFEKAQLIVERVKSELEK